MPIELSDRSPPWAAAVLWVVGLAVTASLSVYTQRSNETYASQEFRHQSRSATDVIVRRMQTYEFGLRGARGAVSVSNGALSREGFHRYTRTRDLAEFPGALGFGYAQRVPLTAESAFVTAARADGQPLFEVRQFTPHPGERWVIKYLEPLESNRLALGLDIASEASRRAAADRAMRTGFASLSAPLTILQAPDKPLHAFVLLLSVKADALAVPTSEAERVAGTLGWTFAPLLIDEVVAGQDVNGDGLGFTLADVTEQENEPFLSVAPTVVATSPADLALSFNLVRVLYGRRWSFTYRAPGGFVDQLHLTSPLTVLAWGALGSTLLAAFLLVSRRLRRRTAQGLGQRALLALVVDRSPDAVIVISREGLVQSWEGAAPALFGYQREEAVGGSLVELIGLQADAPTAGLGLVFDRTVRCRDGAPLTVSVAVTEFLLPSGASALALTVRDIDERKRKEQELERQVALRTQELERARHEMHAVFDALPSMVGYWDSALNNRLANRAYEKWFGVTPETLVGKHLSELLGPSVFELNRRHVEGALRGEPQLFERELTNAAGERRTWLTHYIPDLVQGVARGFFVLLHDITELTRTQQQLEDQRNRIAGIIEATGVGTWEYNVLTGAITYNDTVAGLLGLEPGQLTMDVLQVLTHPDDLELGWAALDDHLRGATPAYETELRVRHRKGHWVWLLSRAQVVKHTAEGKPEWVYGTFLDVTRTNEERRRLKDNEAFLARSGQLAGVGGWELDVETDQVTWTAETFKMLEVPVGFIPTRAAFPTFFAPESLNSIVRAREAALSEGTAWDLELAMVTLSGRRLWARSVGNAERVNGKTTRLSGAFQDITLRRQADEVLRRATDAAQAANKAKSQFLANMSHEIRTPLNAIIGLSHLLEQTALDEDQRSSVTRVQLAGRSLLGVINDVLDLSKIEAGEMTLEKQPFNLHELLRELEDVLCPQAAARGLAFSMKPGADVPASVLGDATRVRQVVTNLVSNALKFTERGEVVATVTCLESKASGVQLMFKVRDTGIGIAKEALARLFTPFTQADASTTRRFGGTGLGLSIVRRLTELMGGEVGASSTVGVGSEFWAVVSLQHTSTAETHEKVELLALLPEDFQRLGQLTGQLGWRSQQVETLEALGAAVDLHPACDVLLLDASQVDPANVRALLASRPGLPPIVVVGGTDSSSRSGWADLVAGQLARPLQADALFNLVDALRKKHGGRAALGSVTRLDTSLQWLRGARVLVVDDSKINLEVAQRMLERSGAVVTARENGREAIELLAFAPTEFDLVLMDTQMPEMDGNEATAFIRQELQLTSLPLVALTAGALVAERQRALDAGVDDFMTKPMDPVQLIRVVRHHVERTRGAPLQVVLRSSAASAEWPEVPGVDTRELPGLTGGVPRWLSLLDSLFSDFASLAEEDFVQALRGDRTRLLETVHTLRASAGLLGAHRLQRAASTTELALTANEGCEAALRELRQALRSLRKAVAGLKRPDAPPADQQRSA